jgi:hypothetical protein
MFATLSRSWEYAKISYGIIWDYKKLVIFPLASTIAAVLVLGSFLLPLWASGTLETWMQFVDNKPATQATTSDYIWMYATLFLFYFCNYFVIVFFNCGLTACAMKVVAGEAPTLGYGFSIASKRLPQILAWAFISAIVGVLLKMVENANEKVGRWIAAILGTAWSALTYFVVPVLVVDGVGPILAIKLSAGTLKGTWGEAVTGRFSLGFLSFLVLLPAFIVAGILIALAINAGSVTGMVLGIALGVMLIIIATAVTSAADQVFKALLYNYATGRTLPAGIDKSTFGEAFGVKG